MAMPKQLSQQGLTIKQVIYKGQYANSIKKTAITSILSTTNQLDLLNQQIAVLMVGYHP